MLSIIAILLHICLADAPAGLYLRGNVKGSLILAVPTLAAIILVLGLALIPSVATKYIGIILAASILAVYSVHASLSTAHALGFIHVRLVAFGIPGAFSFVDCSAEVVWPLRTLALLAFGVLATALSQSVTIRLASTIPAACVGCLSFEHILSHLAADLKGVEASLKDARSTAANAKARLAQKEADLDKVKGAFNGVHIHSDIVLGALKARIAALEADVVAARQDAAARFTAVRELKQLLKVAREDAHKKDTVIAEQQAQLKASEEAQEAIKAELAASNASKARAEAKVATKEDLAVMHAKTMELLKAKIQHLEGVASAAKAQAQREQDAAKLAKAEAAEHKAKADRLESTSERQTRELEQKTQEFKSCHEQITELTHDSKSKSYEAKHWKNEAGLLAADLKASTTEQIDLHAELNRVKTAYYESAARVEELQHALNVNAHTNPESPSSSSAAQVGSGASRQPSSPSAAQASEGMYERTASGKAGDTRVRSIFAREHYAQMDAAMEAKDRELAAAHAEIAMLKKALQGKGKTSSSTLSPATKKTPIRNQSKAASIKAGKENAAPRTPSKSTLYVPVSVSPLRRAVATMHMPSSPGEIPQPPPTPSSLTSRIPRSSIPTLTRPPLARLPR